MSLLLFVASAWAQDVRIESGHLTLPAPIQWESGTATLEAESDAPLTAVAAFLAAKPDITTIRVEAHTDADGDDAANLALSQARSLAVAKWLVAHGVDCSRLVAVGFGETKPVADNGTPEGKAQNRRVEFVMAALRGHAIGGMPLDGGGMVAGDVCAK
jgi:OOP family OmpA-OmpF porin